MVDARLLKIGNMRSKQTLGISDVQTRSNIILTMWEILGEIGFGRPGKHDPHIFSVYLSVVSRVIII